MDHMIHETTVQHNRAGNRPRPSLAEESWALYRLAQALGDSATMQIASRDIEIAQEMERANELVEPLPDGRYGYLMPGKYREENEPGKTAFSCTFPPAVYVDEADEEEAA